MRATGLIRTQSEPAFLPAVRGPVGIGGIAMLKLTARNERGVAGTVTLRARATLGDRPGRRPVHETRRSGGDLDCHGGRCARA